MESRKNLTTGILFMLVILLVYAAAGCSSVANEMVFRSTEATATPQIIIGVDRNRFFEAYPNANLEALWFRALDFGVTFYGDDVYAPKWTGSGLSFADPDRIVPQILSRPLASQKYYWFPVNDHSTDKLPAMYSHWKAKGWLSATNWFFFLPGISDETRTVDEINYNNIMRAQYKALYPEIKWVVTREITAFDPAIPVPQGDIYFPMLHMYELEKAYLAMMSSSANMAYASVLKGGYISGWTADPASMTPGWYATNWKRNFVGSAPVVPVLTPTEAGLILGYCKAQDMKFFLYWDINGLLQPGTGTQPEPTLTTIKLLGH